MNAKDMGMLVYGGEDFGFAAEAEPALGIGVRELFECEAVTVLLDFEDGAHAAAA
jgi:hypothetical protein